MKVTGHQLLAAPMLVVVLGSSGCSAVQPWERGTLAKPHMALEPNPILSTLRAHNYGSREGSAGGGSAGGGGCGCY